MSSCFSRLDQRRDKPAGQYASNALALKGRRPRKGIDVETEVDSVIEFLTLPLERHMLCLFLAQQPLNCRALLGSDAVSSSILECAIFALASCSGIGQLLALGPGGAVKSCA